MGIHQRTLIFQYKINQKHFLAKNIVFFLKICDQICQILTLIIGCLKNKLPNSGRKQCYNRTWLKKNANRRCGLERGVILTL